MEAQKFVVKFDYNIENINRAIAEADKLDVSNIPAVKDMHKVFVKIRTTIKDQEKEMVDEANKFRNEVFAKRNEYLELSEPVEKRLKDILDSEEKRILLETRRELLGEKREKLERLKIARIPSDDELLELDEKQWVEFYATCLQEHEATLAAEERARIEEADRKKREEDMIKAAEEKAREDEKRKAEEKIRQLEIEKEQARQAEIARVAAEKAAEEKAAKDAEALAKSAKYNQFLEDNGYNDATDIIKDSGETVLMYRLVATFNK